jgi:hypothetical protein
MGSTLGQGFEKTKIWIWAVSRGLSAQIQGFLSNSLIGVVAEKCTKLGQGFGQKNPGSGPLRAAISAGPTLGLFFCAGSYAGPDFSVLGPMLHLIFLCRGLRWASFFCAWAYPGPHLFVLAPILGLMFLCWGLCWALLFPCWRLCWALSLGGDGLLLAGVGLMLGLIVLSWGLRCRP